MILFLLCRFENFGIPNGGRPISNLRYADDTALIANNHQDICQLLERINEEGKLKNMKFKAKKTKVMYIGKKQYLVGTLLSRMTMV